MLYYFLTCYILFSPAQALALNCSKAPNQLAINQCWAQKLAQIDNIMHAKLNWIIKYYHNNPKTKYIKKAHEYFVKYRQITCQGVFNVELSSYGEFLELYCKYSLAKSYIDNLEKFYFPLCSIQKAHHSIRNSLPSFKTSNSSSRGLTAGSRRYR